jgi:hypothetical protein
MPRLLLLLVLSLGNCLDIASQPDRNQKFSIAAYLGANLAQIDGDYYFGYNKVGLNFGIESQVLLNPKYFLSIGLGYSQLGARPTKQEINERGGRSLELQINSVEIPILLNYRLGKKSEGTKKADHKLFRSTVIRVGLSVSRSTGFRVSRFGNISALPQNQNFVSVQDRFNQFDLFAIIGVTIPVDFHWSIFAQHSKSVLGLYRPEELILNEVLPLFPYSLSFGARYQIY